MPCRPGDLQRQRAEPGIVRRRHVGESRLARRHRTDQRIPGGQVQVVGDQHQRARLEAGPDAARGVGGHEDRHAQGGEDPRRQRRDVRRMPFVQVKAPALGHHRLSSQGPDHQFPAVALHRRDVESRNLRVRDPHRVGQPIGEVAQPGAQDDRRPWATGRRDRRRTAAAAASTPALTAAGASVTAGSPRSPPR